MGEALARSSSRLTSEEQRRLKEFEKASGVDVGVDDTPGVVVVSAFDGVRRETARRAMVKLIKDGRIHPARIEETVRATVSEMEQHINEMGKRQDNLSLRPQLPNHGVKVKVLEIPSGADKATILERFAAAMTPRTRLLFLSHVQFSCGLRLPARELAELARDVGERKGPVAGAESTATGAPRPKDIGRLLDGLW